MDFRQGQPGLLLNETWSFAFSDSLPSEPIRNGETLAQSGLTLYTATVPGNFELDLQANGLIEEPFFGMNIAELPRFEKSHIWYHRRFEAVSPEGRETVLLFEGLDCCADIYLNGERIGSTDNMLIEHVFPVTLQRQNELLVHIRPAVEEAQHYPYPSNVFAGRNNYESLYIRKAPHMMAGTSCPAPSLRASGVRYACSICQWSVSKRSI